MADYYLKTDNIMKNMFTVALKDELAAQSRMGTVHNEQIKKNKAKYRGMEL